MRLGFVKSVTVLSLFIVCLLSGCSDDGTSPRNEPSPSTDMEHAWSQSFGDASEQVVYDVATDASGNIIITGFFEGTVHFGHSTLASAGQEDIFVAKFRTDGTLLWSQRFGDASDQYGFAVAVDASGNILLTGRFSGTIDFGGGALASAGGSDVYLAKFNSSGAHLWSKRFGDSSTEEARSVTTDPSGNVYITGSYFGSIDFGGGPFASNGYEDIFLAKFDPDGTHLWSAHFGDGDSQYGRDVATDGSGNVILAGEFYGSVDFGGGLLASAGTSDIVIAKFGSDGSHIWSKRFGDTERDYVPRVTVDSFDNIIIAGYFEGTVDFGGGTFTSSGDTNIFIAKFGSGGNHLWSDAKGDQNYYHAYGLAVDESGNIVISGEFDWSFDFGGGVLENEGDFDVFIAKLDPAGVHMWSDSFGNTTIQHSQAVAVDASGNVIMVGNFHGTIDFGGGDLTSAGGHDIFVTKFE